jgi:hypothetical protein
MKNLMDTDYNKSFQDIYNDLPPRSAVKAPKSAFIEEIAKITMKAEITVRLWLSGSQRPDKLTQDIISKHFNIPAEILFPEPENKI